MADDKQPDSKSVEERGNVKLHLNKDPNDPRRVPAAKANLSDLNAEDPEKEPEFQNPVKE